MTHEPLKPTEPVEPDPVAEAAPGSGSMGLLAYLDRHMHYPNAYAWLLLFSALDVMLTWVILHAAGHEVNPIAERVIDHWGLNGMIVYKFALVTVFILICELVGTLRDSTGRTLSRLSIMIAAAPVVWSIALLLRHTLN